MLCREIAPVFGMNFEAPAGFRYCFSLPNLKYFVADGIKGLDELIKELFGPGVIRIACYFHVHQGLTRWMKAPGLGPNFKFSETARTTMTIVMVDLSLAENLPEFFLKWRHWIVHILQLTDSRDADWIKGDELVKHFKKRLIQDDDSNRWCRALIGDHYDDLCRAVRSTRSESFFSSLKRVLLSYCKEPTADKNTLSESCARVSSPRST